MGIGKKAISSGEAILDRALCVGGAAVFSQAPEFMQQYAQRLGGHLDEARLQLGRYEELAHQANLPLDVYIARISANSDAVIAKVGGVVSDLVERVQTLAEAQAAFQGASVFTKPLAFFSHLDTSIAQNTWAAFKPAVPMTIEGLVYAAVGIVATLLLYHGCIRFPLARGWRKLMGREAAT
ncbi:MAG: DUF2937 family protein [Betaproteobacteria bacterium]|nr:DUF2937 family protein [Betaproteobacteria bacterium]MCL2885267.1 DUF2937 family protein [Betaproteobacteria bacterium]